MAGFQRVSGADRGFERFTTSSLAITQGDLLVFDRANNVVIKATSSTSMEDVAGVAVETITSAETSVLVQRVTEDDEYVVNTTNNTTTASNYERMVLTDENEVNNTGTDSTSDAAVFMQISPVGAAADKKIRGRFVTKVDRA
jgi:hypothetical protein